MLCNYRTLFMAAIALANLPAMVYSSPTSKLDPRTAETVDFEWEVQATPGEPSIKLSSTIEQVYQQLVAINPSYDAEFGFTDTTADSSVESQGQAAIWWGNDSSSTKVLTSFGSIADGAQYIKDRCQAVLRQQGVEIVATPGQAFHSTNWNVIVREASC